MISVKHFVVVVVVVYAMDPPSTTLRVSNTPYCEDDVDDDDGVVGHNSTFVDAESHIESSVNSLPRPPRTIVQSVPNTSCSYYSRSTTHCCW